MTSESKSKVLSVSINGERAKSRLIWAPVILFLLLSGCAATSMMVGVSEPDLSRIKLADQRSQVERILGERRWRLGLADEFLLTYDVYQFDVDRPARPFVGAIVLGLDVISLGMLEFNVADVRKFTPVKQVVIVYDGQDRVRFVSQPWLVKEGGPCRNMRSLLPADAGVPSTLRPYPMAHPVGSASKVAILEFPPFMGLFNHTVTIDGHKIEGNVVELSPGRHSVSYGYSLLVDVELLPGRLYRMKSKRFYPGYRAREDVVWIEDVDSGETLYCVTPR